jgi:hypothetical protein
MDYTSAQRALDKLQRETTILSQMRDGRPDADHVEILLLQAKRVRTASTLAVRALAQIRDQLQP